VTKPNNHNSRSGAAVPEALVGFWGVFKENFDKLLTLFNRPFIILYEVKVKVTGLLREAAGCWPKTRRRRLGRFLYRPGAGERIGKMAETLVADKGHVVTNLFDVEEHSQFEALYRANGLHSVKDKIDYLKKSMKIKASISDEDETPEEELAGLEEAVLNGFWKGYNDDDFLKFDNGDISLDDAITHNGGHLELVNTSILFESCV